MEETRPNVAEKSERRGQGATQEPQDEVNQFRTAEDRETRDRNVEDYH